MLLKSLFCFQGADQGARFALISVSAYLGFVLSYFLFYSVPLLLLVVLAALTIMLMSSSVRRVNDAEIAKFYAAIPVTAFLSIACLILFSGNPGSYFLLLLGLIVTLGLTLPPAKTAARYVFGYHGPIDTVVKSMPISNRIEPTLVEGDEQAAVAHQPVEETLTEEVIEPAVDLVQPIRDWYQQNQKLAQGIAGGVSVLALILTIVPTLNFESTPQEVVQKPVEPAKPVKVRDYALEMPSDYYLMLDQNDGLILHWQTSDSDNPELWSILTGKGDDSCKALVFNDKKRIRTNFVSVENGGDYYAELSPLDTKTAVKAIADKSSFSLCGYDFSLRGSRATIDGSETYYIFLQ